METPRLRRRWKILAAFCGPSSQEAGGLGPLQELADIADIEVHALRNPSLQDVAQAITAQRPSLLYLSSGIGIVSSGAGLDDISLKPLQFKDGRGQHKVLDPQQLTEAFGACATMEAIVVDAQISPDTAESLHSVAQNVVFWSEAHPAPALTAAVSSKAFFAMLRDESVTAAEAFWVASQAIKLQCLGERKGKARQPVLPSMISPCVVEVPDTSSIPEPVPMQVGGGRTLDLSRGIVAAIPCWPALRLLAAAADVRLLVAAAPTLVDAPRLGELGNALRALLVVEVRSTVVTSAVATEKVPAYLPPSFRAVRCACRSSSGARFSVTLGGPPEVVREAAVAEHAVRHLLVADALALAVAVPPPGVPAPLARSSEAVACGTPVIDVLATTSLWATVLLKTLAQDKRYRALVALSIAAVSGTAVAAWTADDGAFAHNVLEATFAPTIRPPLVPLTLPPRGQPYGPAVHASFTAPQRPFVPLASPSTAATLGEETPPEALFPQFAVKTGHKPRPIIALAAESPVTVVAVQSASVTPAASAADGTDVQSAAGRQGSASGADDAVSTRPPLQSCSEAEFLEDVRKFLSAKRGKVLPAVSFPDAKLNGAKLDLFNLYKEVTNRGGITPSGDGFGSSNLNWKAQVFPRMRNWTAANNMTAIGSTLKRHYQTWLAEYQDAHPEDLVGDICAGCGCGDDGGTDWISCDECTTWMHFSCDARGKTGELGNYKDYVGDEDSATSRSFTCSGCHVPKRQRTG